jgi:hypothetical protein
MTLSKVYTSESFRTELSFELDGDLGYGLMVYEDRRSGTHAFVLAPFPESDTPPVLRTPTGKE